MENSDCINQARREILINKDFNKALAILDEFKEKGELFYNTLGLAYLEIGNYTRAAEIYKHIGEKYPAGFCELLLGHEKEAKALWESAPDSPPCTWGRALLDYINLGRGPVPTFLQIRNHLEVDMGYFIQANKHVYVENLMKCDDIFISINFESYKLIGRVLLNYGYLNLAKSYFIKSIGILPEDAEGFYYLGLCLYQAGLYKECRESLERALGNNPSHLPSRRMLERLKVVQ